MRRRHQPASFVKVNPATASGAPGGLKVNEALGTAFGDQRPLTYVGLRKTLLRAFLAVYFCLMPSSHSDRDQMLAEMAGSIHAPPDPMLKQS